MKRHIGKFATLFTAFSLFASAVPVFSEEETEAIESIHLTKTLVTPDPSLVTLPASFNFEFTVDEVEFIPYGATEADPSVTVPDIADQTLTFTSSEDLGTVADGVKTTFKQTSDLLEGLEFPEAGIYYYTISETPDTVTLTDVEKETLEYDGATYILKVYVSRDEAGETVIDGGTVQDDEENKVDPSVTEPTTGGGTKEVVSANGFEFINIYTVEAGSTTPPDPENTEAGLVITKAIEGDLSNAEDEFTYQFELNNNALVDGKTYILSTPTENIEVTPGTPVTFVLKGGEKAALLNVPAGVSFDVTETNYGYYTPTNALLLNSVETASTSNVAAGGLMGENSNKVDYTNTWEKTTPTGIIMNNLPFMALILASLGGLGLYYVTKQRGSNS